MLEHGHLCFVVLYLGWGHGQSTDLAGKAGDFPCGLIPMHNAFARRFAQRTVQPAEFRRGRRHVLLFYRRHDFFIAVRSAERSMSSVGYRR